MGSNMPNQPNNNKTSQGIHKQHGFISSYFRPHRGWKFNPVNNLDKFILSYSEQFQMNLYEERAISRLSGSKWDGLKFALSYIISRLIVLLNSIFDLIVLLLMNYLITYWSK